MMWSLGTRIEGVPTMMFIWVARSNMSMDSGMRNGVRLGMCREVREA